MSIIQERVGKVKALTKQIKEHHMCLHFEETDTHYLVHYPYGFNNPAAIRVEIDNNKAKALARLIPMMDKHWNESCWWLE